MREGEAGRTGQFGGRWAARRRGELSPHLLGELLSHLLVDLGQRLIPETHHDLRGVGARPRIGQQGDDRPLDIARYDTAHTQDPESLTEIAGDDYGAVDLAVLHLLLGLRQPQYAQIDLVGGHSRTQPVGDLIAEVHVFLLAGRAERLTHILVDQGDREVVQIPLGSTT